MSGKKQAPNKKGFPIPLLLIIGGGVLLIAIAVLLAGRNTPEAVTPTTAPSVQATANTQSDIPYPEVPRVSLEDAKAAFDEGTAVFVDVRSAEAYALSHIPGALSIPTTELGTRLGELDKEQWIITYCT
jgi:3-mercaptopyruvate sulfurtransferase SseA